MKELRRFYSSSAERKSEERGGDLHSNLSVIIHSIGFGPTQLIIVSKAARLHDLDP